MRALLQRGSLLLNGKKMKNNSGPDSLCRVISQSGKFFGIACDTTAIVGEACHRHNAGPTAAAAMGRALTGAVLLAALLKNEQSVLLRFEGNGALRKVVTEAGYGGWVRGYVAEPLADVPLRKGQIDVAAGIGRAGFLTVVKDIGLPTKYKGMTRLLSGEVGEDIAFYLTESEQIPSAVSLGVEFGSDGMVLAAGGFLVQSLPPADESVIGELEERIRLLPPVTALLTSGKKPEEILQALFVNIPHKTLGSRPLSYRCSCSREKMESALLSLGRDELGDLLEKEGRVQVNCEFCRNNYWFSGEELMELMKQISSSP